MDITTQIIEHASRSEFLGNALPYDDFINSELGPDFLASNAPRDVDDAVSFLGWVTSKEGVLTLSYSTLSGNISHGAALRYQHNTLTGQHTHNHIELAYVSKGRLLQKIAGKTEEFSEGEVCLIDRESLHGDCLLHEAATAVFIGIDTAFFNHHLLDNKKTTAEEQRIKELIALRKWKYDFVRFKPAGEGLAVMRTLELMLEELLEDRPCRTKVVSAYIERLLHMLTGEYHIDPAKKDRSEIGDSLFKDMERYVREHYASTSVKEMARQYSYSPDYLSRLCFKKAGMGLSQYIQRIRMEEAMTLLERTDLSIEQIANKVGYHNLGFFYQKFKERYQTTPQNIRDEIR